MSWLCPDFFSIMGAWDSVPIPSRDTILMLVGYPDPPIFVTPCSNYIFKLVFYTVMITALR